MNNRTHRLFMILIFFMTLLSVFSTSVVDAYIPPAQSGTQSFSGSNFSYATIGYTVSLNRNTTSISIHDDGFLRADTTASAVYTHEPKTIVNSSTRERYIRGSVYTRQYDGTYCYFNINIRLNPANFSSSNLVKGRSLLDNLYLEPATNIDTLNGLLSSERTGFLNPIYAVATEAEHKNSNWPNTHRLKPKYLWGDSPSNKYVKRTSVYTTRRIYQSLVWTPHTTGTMSDAFERQVSFPIVDDFPPVLKSWDVQGSGLYKEGSNTFWTKPGNKITAIVEQSDTGVGNKTQHFRTYKWPYDKITTRDYHDFFRADTSFGSQITSSDLVVNSAKRTSNTKASGKVEWDFTPIVANSTFRIETHMRDNFDNNSGYEIFAYVKTDNNSPEEKGVMIDANVIHQDGDTYWVKPGTRTSVEIAQKDARSGDRFQYLRVLKGTEDIRARHEFAGNTTNKYNVSTFSQSNSNMSIDSVSRTVKNDIYYVKWMVTPIQANQTFNIQYHLADNVGNTLDYEDNGVNIKTDSVRPSRVKETITNYNGKSGNTYWIKPGSTANVVLKGSDSGSGLRDTRLSVGGGSNRLLSQHMMSGSSDNHSTSSTLTGMELSKVSRNTNNEVVYEMKGLDHGSRHQIRSYFSDNVQNISDGDIYGWGNLSDTFYLGVDGVGPTISASEDSRDWTNTSNSVNVSLSDADSGVKDYRFYQSGSATLNRSMLDSSSWVTGDSFTFGRPGSVSTYYTFVEARDNAGNITYKRLGPYRYDGTAPTASNSGNPTQWTNQNPTLKLNITDTGGSGYSHTKLPNGVTSTSTTPGYMVSRNGTYTFTIYDNAGNSRNISIQVTKIDKSLPSLTLTQSPGGWTNGSVIIMASASDTGGSGVKGIRRPNGTWSDGSGASQVVTSNGTYEFTVEDNAGNTRTVSQKVTNIDKSNPNGTVTQNINGWTNGNVILTFNASDTGGSGVKQVRQAGGTWVSGSSTTRTVSSNGTYSFEVEDHAGNKRTISHTVTNIDKSNPTGTVTPNITAWTNQNVVLTFNATDTGGSGVRRVRQTGGSWVNGSSTTRTVTSNGTYSFEVEDHAGNTRIVTRNVTNIDKSLPSGAVSQNITAWTNQNVLLTFKATDTGGSGVRRVRQTGGSWVNGSSTTRTVTSNGTYSFEVEDHAGNTRTISHNVTKIDKSNPNGTVIPNITDWTNQNVVLTFNATDTGGSGVRRVRQTGGSWVSGSSMTRTVTTNGTYSFEVEDHAGNTRIVSYTVSNIDKVLPNGSITGNPTSWTNQDVILRISSNDNASGVKRIRLPNGSWVNSSSVSYTVSVNGTYSFVIQDHAGNTRTVTEIVNRIDKTKPNANANHTPTDWTNKPVDIKVTSSDNQSGISDISLIDKPYDSPKESKLINNTKTFTVTENGTYTFEVSDVAGNKTIFNHTVSNIDKQPPSQSTIEISK